MVADQDSQQTVDQRHPERIYDLVSDLPRMGEWSPECERVEWTAAATSAAVGARFVGHNRGGPFRLMHWSRRGRVLAADPGREFAFVTEEGGRESTVWRYRFEAVDAAPGSPSPTRSGGSRPGPGSSTSRPTGTASCAEGMQHTLARLKAMAEPTRRGDPDPRAHPSRMPFPNM